MNQIIKRGRVPANRMQVDNIENGFWIEVCENSDWVWRRVESHSLVYESSAIMFILETGRKIVFDLNSVVAASVNDPVKIPNKKTVPDWDDYFLGIAESVASRAKCRRRQCGSIIVDPQNRIISTGYNGFPRGISPDCMDGGCPRGLTEKGEIMPDSPYTDPCSPGFCPAIHSEANSLLYASGKEVTGATLYVTDKPCPDCMRLIAGSGISRVIYPGNEIDPQSFYKQEELSHHSINR